MLVISSIFWIRRELIRDPISLLVLLFFFLFLMLGTKILIARPQKLKKIWEDQYVPQDKVCSLKTR